MRYQSLCTVCDLARKSGALLVYKTVLRQRMIDEMTVRNLPAQTQASYVQCVSQRARYCLLYLANESDCLRASAISSHTSRSRWGDFMTSGSVLQSTFDRCTSTALTVPGVKGRGGLGPAAKHWLERRSSFGFARQTSIPLTTFPLTSVSRKSRPWE